MNPTPQPTGDPTPVPSTSDEPPPPNDAPPEPSTESPTAAPTATELTPDRRQLVATVFKGDNDPDNKAFQQAAFETVNNNYDL